MEGEEYLKRLGWSDDLIAAFDTIIPMIRKSAISLRIDSGVIQEDIESDNFPMPDTTTTTSNILLIENDDELES